jgi:cephalosporin hydroxylase
MSGTTRSQRGSKLALLREAGKSIEHRGKRLLSPLRRAWHRALIPYRPGGRKWRVGLPFRAVQSIQVGTMEYSYRGTPMIKNPFEVALYPLLLWRVKPRTVIEIGSYRGASALWFADILRTCDVDAQVISVDVEPPVPPESRDNVHFLRGDANALGDVFTPEKIAAFQRPLLVFEDSNHVAETTLAVLDFFATVLRPGEYIVVVDAAVTDLGWAHRFNGGPGLAISRFLAAHRDFEIDTSLCDFYGHNFTGNPNGYLRRR